jgi:predicted nuclease with RNAse H fold/dephospho-CoA kinase
MRAKAGIMRVSERILKRRGINVYPCLLPSMQRLTERGMRLAIALRARGIQVIECYPGAAQDIMGIPRKGAGEEWLRLGLSDFGVIGRYKTQRVTHDELDAITCSVVGFFHIAGLSEGIGGEGEEPMIIPDLHAGKGLVVGVSGPMFAGKTTAARFLESEGYAYTRISEVIDDVLRERGEQITRENQQRVGLELHEEKGQRWLCQRAIERLTGAPTRIVIDGLRWIEDIAYFRERYGGRFRHIHLDVPLSLRRERAERNGKLSMFEVARMHPVEQGIAKIATMAQDQIVNDGDLQGLYAKLVEDIISQGDTHAD